MNLKLLSTVVAVVVLFGAATPVLAQRSDASVRGTVTDPSDLVVPDAKVTIVNAETGLHREAMTGAAGTYSFPRLPVGTYVLTVEVEGFKTLVVENVVLNVGAQREVNAQLEAGQLEAAVTVTSSAVVVETISGEVSGLITGEQVRELPLNGRNFLQLTQLMPGVATLDNFNTKNKGLLTGSDISVSGGRVTSNAWTVDGASNNDFGSNRTILVYPSLEAVEEFKVHRNSYGAEFGGAGGAQINLVTRGGTNQLQGSAYYFVRDDAWNSKNYILEQTGGDKEPLDRDDYGYTLGGAIKKDRLHFFVSQEWNDEVRGIVQSAFVPTAAELQGDFSQSGGCSPIPTDPLTGNPFPGNVIPADRINEAGQLYLQLYPTANASTSGCNNWVQALPVPINWKQVNARVDWDITSRVHAMVRYTEDDWDNLGPTAGSANGLWGDDPFPQVDSTWEQPSDSIIAQVNAIIGNSAINTLSFSRNGNEIIIGQTGDLGLLEAIRNSAPPTLGPKTANPTGHAIFWGGGGLSALWNAGPWNNEQDLKILKDDYEQVFGNHVLKVGAVYSENKKSEVVAVSSAEMPAYWGATGLNGWGGSTGNTIADFLLDDMAFGFSEKTHNAIADTRWEDFEAYIADSWKVRPNVTFDFGFRFTKYDWPYDNDNNIYLSFNPDTFDPALGGAACNGLMQVPGTSACADQGIAGAVDGPNKNLVNNNSYFAPRLGLAWDVFEDGESVLRVGFGQFYQRERVSPSLGMVGNPPAVGFTGGWRTIDGSQTALDFVGTGRPSMGFDVNGETPYNLQYNITWEQRLGRDSTIEVSYVGSRGYDMLRSNEINQVRPGDVDGNGVFDRLDYIRCGQDDGGCRQQYRPFGAFGDGDIAYWTTDGKSEYNSLQTQYTLRYGQGSQFQASYTWATFEADTGMNDSSGGFNADATTTDLSNRSLDWTDAILARDHTFNASMIHNLPTFEGAGGFKEHFLGNWSIGGIAILATGTPLTAYGANPGGDLAGRHPAGMGYDNHGRPIRVPGVGCGGKGLQVLNPDAFTFDGYVLGDSAQQSKRSQCEGPSFAQVDLSLFKQIPFGDRFNVQLRFEFFNIFNTTNIVGQSVNTDFNAPVTLDAPRGQATRVVSTGSPSGVFGTASAVRDPRQVQLGIKFTF